MNSQNEVCVLRKKHKNHFSYKKIIGVRKILKLIHPNLWVKVPQLIDITIILLSLLINFVERLGFTF